MSIKDIFIRNGREGRAVPLQEPTTAAFVKITTPAGPTGEIHVPGKEASRLLETAEFIAGLSGTVIGPYLMAKALKLDNAGVPWGVQTALLALAALLPATCCWMSIRRRRG
ncbi:MULTISPECIES: hypothetical protein [Streptomyces]|uniref:Uncharacterized protein n=1 Tax=Streptomyces murinus TaxID=33900 RepID=A0A7W3NT77_STRMR|nr:MULTISPECIES: hypothetical protein [Streptomyces]MBA9056300.1 hypothetical protein [Streptomyces murinus]